MKIYAILSNTSFVVISYFQIEPHIVAKHCVKSDYSLLAPFPSIDRKLQILLDYNLKPLSILKGLYALENSETIYISRLERLMSLNAKDFKFWLFKCADDVFEKHINKLQQTNRNCYDDSDKIELKETEKNQLKHDLNDMLECDIEEAAHIYYNQINHFDQLDIAKQNIEFLRSQGVSLESITANSAVLVTNLGIFLKYLEKVFKLFLIIIFLLKMCFIEQLQENMRIIEVMESRHIDDLLPLICIQKNELVKFKKILDEHELHSEHPIYYFSKKLKVR